MADDLVDIAPRFPQHAATTTRSEVPARASSGAPSTAAVMSAAATAGGAAKSFMSMSNEYWLIGIIIVLVTVILMLIVYVVKIKQSAKPAIDPGAAALSPALPPLRIAESDDAAVDTEQIARIAHQQFVPRSARRGVSIEPIPSNSSGSGSAGDDNTPRA
ncbi:MAG: hypothetical protein M0R66_03015, partial [Candidatus Omnitrophica bacterium]|nr:hypothetical protein [Candidatus Omnitrophota bacterium]